LLYLQIGSAFFNCEIALVFSHIEKHEFNLTFVSAWHKEKVDLHTLENVYTNLIKSFFRPLF